VAKLSGITATNITWQEAAAPSTPASTKWITYFKTDGLYYKDDAGAETGPLAAGGALGTWTDYTPTWTASTTNPTLGSTTITGRFKLLDSKTGLVNINIAITTGGAWNAGSGNYIFSLPAGWTAHATRIQVGSCHVLDSGTAHFSGTCKVVGGSTQISETVIGDASGNRLLANTVPVTWATGDQINLSILVEIQ
jgi:hypothetical protein